MKTKKQPKKKEEQKEEKRVEKVKTNNPMARRWCFTIYPEKLKDVYFQLPDDLTTEHASDHVSCLLQALIPGWRGLVFSLEEGDSKEHKHIQGYFELYSPSRFNFLQREIGVGVHLEIAKGGREDNFDYILHTGDHTEKGKLHWTKTIGNWPKTSGEARNMYDECVEMILEGRSIRYIALKYKGAILPQLGNLKRLQQEVERENEVESAFLEVSRRSRLNYDTARAEDEIIF